MSVISLVVMVFVLLITCASALVDGLVIVVMKVYGSDFCLILFIYYSFMQPLMCKWLLCTI